MVEGLTQLQGTACQQTDLEAEKWKLEIGSECLVHMSLSNLRE